jgi:hypothetical protein
MHCKKMFGICGVCVVGSFHEWKILLSYLVVQSSTFWVFAWVVSDSNLELQWWLCQKKIRVFFPIIFLVCPLYISSFIYTS